MPIKYDKENNSMRKENFWWNISAATTAALILVDKWRKMFFDLSPAWDKEKILSPN